MNKFARKRDLTFENSLVNSIEQAIKGDKNPFSVGLRDSADLWKARNAITNDSYNGVNALMLGILFHQKGHKSNAWVNEKQINDLGLKLHPQAEPVLVLNDNKSRVYQNTSRIKYHKVYNIGQTEGFDFVENKTKSVANQEMVDVIIEKCPVKVLAGGDTPVYVYHDDHIEMPTNDVFNNTNERKFALLHEIIHATGHKTRLNRFTGFIMQGNEIYAQEELTTGIAMIILAQENGFEIADVRHERHVSYWFNQLKDCPDLIKSACDRAFETCKYITTHWA